jgi:single-stranded-DNA-specific exonuclease
LAGIGERALQIEIDFTEDEQNQQPRTVTSSPGVFSSRRWEGPKPVPAAVTQGIQRALPLQQTVSPILPDLLASRGLTEPAQLETFFFASSDQYHDPFLLQDMRKAVDRLLAAASGQQSVAVHGDFDVDGLTGTALLYETFSALTVDGNSMRLEPPFVPDRLQDGYGVSQRMLKVWGERKIDLLVTVDTGSSAAAEVEMAVAMGMEVVVLDHHLFTEDIPQIHALVNPCREDNTYPNAELSGVGVAFKLAQALTQAAPEALPVKFLASVLDLAAMGLIADQMVLQGENRAIVSAGLKCLSHGDTLRPGMSALFSVSGIDRGFPVTSTQIAYQIAPRLNACGRVGDVRVALDLLLVRDHDKAQQLAGEADRTNHRRRETDALVLESATAAAEPFVQRGDNALVLGSGEWHRGVIGISAARLVELYNVPTILFSIEGDLARGSARSLPGIDVKAVLDMCSDLLIRHGGHSQAAGMSLYAKDLDDFRMAFLDALSRAPAGDSCTEHYDITLPMHEMDAETIARLTSDISLLQPFGEGNRPPVFRANGVRLKRQPATLGKTGEHLKFTFAGPDTGNRGGTPALGREFISFGTGRAWREFNATRAGGVSAQMQQSWDILFQLSTSTWRPRNGGYVDPVQQQLIDIKPADDRDE